jgi:hypothetical protein
MLDVTKLSEDERLLVAMIIDRLDSGDAEGVRNEPFFGHAIIQIPLDKRMLTNVHVRCPSMKRVAFGCFAESRQTQKDLSRHGIFTRSICNVFCCHDVA